MARLHQQPLCLASSLFVPWLTLASPTWLNLSGVGPCWAVLWLLPWALVDGPVSGLTAGLCLGLVLDGLNLGGASQLPALMALGWWWGRLGRRAPPIQGSFNLGLLAWIGTALVGLSLWLQTLLIQFDSSVSWLHSWGLHTFLAQSLITGLVAPLLVSWMLLILRRLARA
ncbi:MAG: rod shape-determining protein MreD [Cyanobacteriota bacterium]|nr:rod shape-determining protein MreD [Cyanobacteriota bacterium]